MKASEVREIVREELLREAGADHEIRIKCNQSAAERLQPLLNTVKQMTQAGMMRQVQVDDVEGEGSFLVDGDDPA